MPDFRDRAEAVKSAGEARRGEFNPTGVPLKVYKYFVEHGGRAPAQENFCHFWRVVVIWAPLMWLVLGATELATKTWVQVSVLVALVATVVFLCLSFHSFAIGIGVAVALAVGVLALFFTVNWIVHFVERHHLGSLIGSTLLISFAVLVGAGVVFALVMLGLEVAWWAPFAVIAGAAALVGLSIGGIWLAEKHTEKNRAKRAKEREERWEFFDEHGHFPEDEREPREPGKVSKFFHGLGDFLILAANIVRVNKWKICPIVTIDE